MEIKTERLILRELQETDEATILRYQAEPEVRKTLLMGAESKQSTQNFIRSSRAQIYANPRYHYGLAITLPGQDDLIGSVSHDIIPASDIWRTPRYKSDIRKNTNLSAGKTAYPAYAIVGWELDKQF